MRKQNDSELLVCALSLPPSLRPKIGRRLRAIGGLVGLWNAGSEALEGVIDETQSQRLEAVLALMGRLLTPVDISRRIEGPADVLACLGPRIGLEAVESFWVLLLDAQARILGFQRIAMGTLTACLVHPREVFAPAIRARAASLIVVHNHPSGEPTPSDEDLALTARLHETGLLIGIPMIDHIVVGRMGARSISPTPPASEFAGEGIHGKAL